MKKIRNYLFTFLIIIFAFLIIFSFYRETGEKKNTLTVVSDSFDTLRIMPFEKNDVFYFFLPSGVSKEDLFLEAENNRISLTSFQEETEYEIELDGERKKIVILASENVPTLYIDLLKKDKEYLNSDKKHEVNIHVYMIHENGFVDNYPLRGTIKGRGNHSWNLSKKAYNLNLEEENDLLDMGKARKWALVSNAMDLSSLRNKTVYEFAGRTGLEWTPEGEYVNLYIDGEYNGLYLLCERVEIGEERLDIGEDGVLLKRELPERLDLVNNGFLTRQGNVIEITNPKKISTHHKEQVMNLVQKMEDAIFDLDSDVWKDVIDIDSWATCYLIDELFDNFDSGIASAYFYLKDDGKFYRGPVWDYDAIMFDDPVSIVANSYHRQPYSTNDYYSLLYQRKEFKNRLIEIYKEHFLPMIQDLTEKQIDELSATIDKARHNDSIRWNFEYEEKGDFKSFLKQRSDFLKEYWENEENYCKVQVQKETFYLTYMVKKGQTISEAHGIDMELFAEKKYCYADSEKVFDVQDPIYEDIRLDFVERKEVPASEQSLLARFGALNLLFLSAFACAMLVLLAVNRKKYND